MFHKRKATDWLSFPSLCHVELGVSQGEVSPASNFNMQGDSPVRYDFTELLEANLPSLGQHSLTLSRSRFWPSRDRHSRDWQMEPNVVQLSC